MSTTKSGFGTLFLTGATGFLGAQLTARLVNDGHRVLVLVRDSPHPDLARLLGWSPLTSQVQGHLTDGDLLERVVSEYSITSVFHLAAQTLVGTAQRSPVGTFESNIRGTWTLLEACRRHADQVKCVIVASSDKAYGVHQQLPYREDFPLQPRFPYDTSKACAEMLAMAYYHSYGLPVAVTRCANLYGGGDLNWSRVVPGTIRAALEGRRPIIRSDGTPIRDYLYVDDAVTAYLTLADAVLAGKAAGQAYNFGTDHPVAVLPLVRQILAASGRPDLEPDVQGTASAEIDRQYLDSSKARRELGWQPTVALDEGLRRAVAWYREFAPQIFL
ncbi:MAG: GDP-mannose 4,6-dehydratase [Terriglobales bacterium]